MAKTPSKQDTAPIADVGADLSFEAALESLESHIRSMESDALPLEDLIESYEQGSQLLKVCQNRLDAAEARIELIRKNRSGENVASSFGPSGSAPGEPGATGEPAPEKNGELF